MLPVTVSVSVSEPCLGRGRRGLVSASSLVSPALPRLRELPVLAVLPIGLLVWR